MSVYENTVYVSEKEWGCARVCMCVCYGGINGYTDRGMND